MPRTVVKSFPQGFADRRDTLLAAVREHAAHHADELRAAGVRLDGEFSDVGVRRRLKEQTGDRGKRALGTPTDPNRPVGHGPRQPEKPVRLTADRRRAERLAWAISVANSQMKGADETNPLGRHLQRGERETNAVYFLVIAGLVLDPDAADWLDGFTDLALCPWAKPAPKRPAPKPKGRPSPPHLRGYLDRREVFGDWGHEALAVLHRACAVLSWTEAAESTVAEGRVTSAPSAIPMQVIAADRPPLETPLDLPKQVGVVREAFDHFYEVLDAVTVRTDGGRRVNGVPHAVKLSEVTSTLHAELSATYGAVLRAHGVSQDGLPPGIRIMASDSPDGPGTEIPASAIRVRAIKIGGSGADALLLAALQDAIAVTAFSVGQWNAAQHHKPGGPHQRWHAGDVVGREQLDVLESTAKQLSLYARGAEVEGSGLGGGSGDGPVHKPDGWTKADLLRQAREDGKIISATKFDTIRDRAKVKAAPKGGAGPHHKYSKAELRKLIAEVEQGDYLNKEAIAQAWRGLLV